MNYFEMVNEAIQYIEDNLDQNLTIDKFAEQYYISKYYFSRIFKALTGKNVKEYLDSRKMAEAAKKLKNTDTRIIDIAFEYGFRSHEAFTRKFKQVFGLTPVDFRRSGPIAFGCQRIEVVERQFKNLHQDMIVDFRIEHFGPIRLTGKYIRFNPDETEDIKKVNAFFNRFVPDYIQGKSIEKMYHVTVGDAAPGEAINYFVGFEPYTEAEPKGFRQMTLVASDYAVFKYKNSLAGIHRRVAADVWKAILLSGLTLNSVEIHFFELYQRGYQQTKEFLLYVPVKE